MYKFTLEIKSLKLRSKNDESSFCDWLNSIESITRLCKIHDELIMEFNDNASSEDSLEQIFALFKRYKLNIKLLHPFLNNVNEYMFNEFPRIPSHSNVYPRRERVVNLFELEVNIEKLKFFSEYDEDFFFRWIENIKSIREVYGIGRKLFFNLTSFQMSDEDLRECIALFNRYNLDMSKLSVFLNNNNKDWFAKPRTYWHKKVFKN